MISFNNIGNLGRLANQMFQYASLKGIARNRGYDFTIPPQELFGQNDELVRNSPLNIYTVFENISKNNIQVVRNPMLQERTHEFDEELFRSCPDNVDLFGYYQSPKYFEHIKDEIKNDFKFSDEVESICNETTFFPLIDSYISSHNDSTSFVNLKSFLISSLIWLKYFGDWK